MKNSMHILYTATPALIRFSNTVVPVLLWLYVSLLWMPGLAEGSERPNILFLLTDDVGIGDIRAYNSAAKISLPAIDRLADEGIRFSDAHTSAAKCAPSRYSIVTGNYQWRGRKEWGQWNYKGGSQILEGQQTLGDMLQRAGYKTAFIGKYHLGAEFYRKGSDEFAAEGLADDLVDFGRPMTDGPNEHGFDRSFVALRGIQDSPYAFFLDGSLNGSVNDLIRWEVGNFGETRIEKAGIGLSNWVTSDVGPTLLSQSLEFIEEHHQAQIGAQNDSPFFLFLNNQAVHSPWAPPESIGETPVRGMSGLTVRTDLLIEIDAILSEILVALQARNMLENTLIIVTSDNGGVRLPQEENAGHRVSAEFRGDKGTIYEGGHRVPLILKWGSGSFGTSSLPSGSTVDALVGIQDIYATLAELTGIGLSNSEGLDSFSFLPILMGAQSNSVRDHMVHEADRPEDNAPDGGISGRHFAFRKGNYKLIFDSSESPVGFYDLGADPGESANLIDDAGQQPRIADMQTEFSVVLNSGRTAPLPPPPNDPPTFTASPPTGATEGVPYSFTVTADDANGDAILITAPVLPAWLTLTDNGDGTAVLSGIPAGADIGDHAVALQADDGNAGTAMLAFTITVTASGETPLPPNDPPTFTASPPTGATEGVPYSFNVTADDANGDAILITAPVLPAWLTLTDNGDGTAVLSGIPAGADIGDHAVALQADDGNAGTATQAFTITVTANGEGPTITLLGDATVTMRVGDTYVDAGAIASDAQDGDLTSGIVVDNPVDTSTAGTYIVTHLVTDSAGNSAQVQRTVIVQVTPPPPTSNGGGGGGGVGQTGLLIYLLAGLVIRARRRRARL